MKSLGFGAIVWDDLSPDYNLGGAVLNVLGHLRTLGWETEMVSALGRDPLGDRTVAAVQRTGVGLRWLRRVEAPTCLVHVDFDEHGDPSYSMEDHVSWDVIRLDPEGLEAIRDESFDVFCFGTIEQRDRESRSALRRLLAEVAFPTVFLDLNLRPPFYDAEIVEYSLLHCDIAKLNVDEASAVKEMLGLEADGAEGLGATLRDRFGIERVLITAGEAGAYYSDPSGYGFVPAFAVTVVDTVGAGDGFSAGLLHRLLSDRGDLASACEFGCRLGGLIASKRSSLPDYTMCELDALRHGPSARQVSRSGCRRGGAQERCM